MRMFLIVMCDLFLILYLTQLTNVQKGSILTVEDFYDLKTMHETLRADKENMEESLEEKLRGEQEEKEKLLAEQKKQEELAKQLEEKLLKEKQKTEDMEKSLSLSNAEKDRISNDLKEKEEMLKSREQLLADLNEEILAKEEARRKMEESYQEDLKSQHELIEENKRLVGQLESEAQQAQVLANQMKQEAAQATKTAQVAKSVQKKALKLRQEALKDKELAEKKASEALIARQKAEDEKMQALKAMEDATVKKKKAEGKAQELLTAIKNIKQDAETAYTNNIIPQVQTVNVSYSRSLSNEKIRYEHELTLLPVKIGENAVVIFPSSQIGFMVRSDRAPDDLMLMYDDKKIQHGWINKENDLVAIELPGYKGALNIPYGIETPIEEFMPILLGLRNNGNVSLFDKIRGIAEDYFVVNRDHLRTDKENNLKYFIRGLRGTGTRAERIVRGDQLVDLNGRLIGICNDSNHVIRVNSVSQWDRIVF